MFCYHFSETFLFEKKAYFVQYSTKAQALILLGVCEVLVRKSKTTNLDYNKPELLAQGEKCEGDSKKTDRIWKEFIKQLLCEI